jgi:prepilin-type N-terminal cleavage/methylation domain-containing protein/prepilin-type processing-associated H-X9-DG protein
VTLARRAFTLVELLIVITIIGLLVALIGAGFSQALDVADKNQCTANLHYLSQAISSRAGDLMVANRTDMKVSKWPARLLPYVDWQRSTFICPAKGSTETLEAQSGDPENPGAPMTPDILSWGTDTQRVEDEAKPTQTIDELVELKVVSGSNTWYESFVSGPYCVQLSDSQYAEARGKGYLGNDDIANNLRDKFDCTYRSDGDGTAYWLCFEDHGGDWDFKDVMVRVTTNDDGTFGLQVHSGSTGHTNSIVIKEDRSHLMSVPANTNGVTTSIGEEKVEEQGGFADGGTGGYGSADSLASGEEGGGIFLTSYAMNAQKVFPPKAAGKILLMDYCKYMARSTDVWSDRRVDPNGDGVPIFARHGHMINVLFTDGSVVQMFPDEINPSRPSVELMYWNH